jgi:hypothetical protein
VIRSFVYMVFATLMFAEPASGARRMCGSHLLPTVPETAYRVTRPRIVRTLGIGDREDLWIRNFESGTFERVSFTCRAVGKHSRILVDDAWWSESTGSAVDPGEMADLLEAFEESSGLLHDSERGIFEIHSTTYAPPKPVGGDSVVYIALTGITGNFSDGYVAGYVNPADLLPPSTYPWSNYRNLVVVDVARGSTTLWETTLAHELTHVIQAGIDRTERRWIDEGTAVYSQELCGYEGNDGTAFFANTNVGLGEDDELASLALYDMAYMLIRFMSDQYGDEFIGAVVRSTRHGVPGIDEVLGKRGLPDRFASDVFPAWAVANLRPPGDDALSYRAFDPTAAHPANFGIAATLPVGLTDTLNPYGLVYLRIVPGEAEASLSVPSGTWFAASLEPGPAAMDYLVRPWFRASGTELRDCGLETAWIIAGNESEFSTRPFTLHVQRPTGTRIPVVLKREPSGSEVSPYRTPLRLEIANADPDTDVEMSVFSERLGELTPDLVSTTGSLDGRCGTLVRVLGDVDMAWPGSDSITVTVSSVFSLYGEELPGERISWGFTTALGDSEPPHVTIGLLANPVLPAFLTVAVYADEDLYSDTDAGMRVVVNDSIQIPMHMQETSRTRWSGAVHVEQSGEYRIEVRAADLAGNPVVHEESVYAIVLSDGVTLARASAGTGIDIAVPPSTSGVPRLVTARLTADGSITVETSGDGPFNPPVLVGIRSTVARGATALSGPDGNTVLAPDTRGEILWAAVSSPGTYTLIDADVRPATLSLGPNRPNPFNPSTEIPVSIPPGPEPASLSIYSVTGQRVLRVAVHAGVRVVTWDGRDSSGKAVASGVYVVSLQHGSVRRTMRATVVR